MVLFTETSSIGREGLHSEEGQGHGLLGRELSVLAENNALKQVLWS